MPINELFKDIGKGMYELYCNPHELEAIWLNQPIMTDYGLKIRITKGMQLRYDNGEYSNSRKDFNYEILCCYGTLIDQFRIKVLNLEKGTEEIIKL